MQQRSIFSVLIVVVVLLTFGVTLVNAGPLQSGELSSTAPTGHRQISLPDPTPFPANSDANSSAAPGGSNTVYLPMIRTHLANVRIAAIEVTQATQTSDNSVPLIANRPALARVHLEGAYSVGPLVVTLSGSRAGARLPGSPLVRTVQPGPFANILLPSTWLSGDIALDAEVKLESGNPNGATINARMEVGISFIEAPPLNITIVPIEYTHLPTGAIYPPPTTFHFLDSVQRMFPVPHINVTVRAPYAAQGDIENAAWWTSFVNTEIVNLARADGAPLTTVYVAVLPLEIMDAMHPALAGIGFSNRMVLAFDYALVATHEMGHALGRKHTNCGNPATNSVDPDYPYQDGVIGAPGYDVVRDVPYEPSSTRDIMSYCEEWVSDYTYRGMLADQMKNGQHVEGLVADALLISGDLSGHADAGLGPVYAFHTRLSQPVVGSEYEVALYGVDGKVIATHGVPVYTTAEEDIVVSQFGVALPRPEQPVARVALLRNGTEIDSRTITLERSNRIRMNARVVGQNLLISNEYLDEAGATIVPINEVQPANSLAQPANTPSASGGPAYILRYHSGLLAAAATDNNWTTLTINASAQTQNYALNTLPTAADGNATVEFVPADTLLITPQGHSRSASVVTTIAVGSGSINTLDTDTPATANHAPAVWFGGINPVALNGSIILTGYASDLEDGALTGMEWRINGAPATTGPLLQISTVDQPLLIELAATDSQGKRSVATMQIAPN